MEKYEVFIKRNNVKRLALKSASSCSFLSFSMFSLCSLFIPRIICCHSASVYLARPWLLHSPLEARHYPSSMTSSSEPSLCPALSRSKFPLPAIVCGDLTVFLSVVLIIYKRTGQVGRLTGLTVDKLIKTHAVTE